MAYLLLKWLHVLSAIVAVGANITYGLWIARASRDLPVLPFTLRTIKILDDRIANPAYAFLLITGFGMTGVGHLSLWMPWLLTSLVLYVVMVVIAAFGFTPTLRRQIRALESGGASSPAYQTLATRSRTQGIVLAVLVLVISFLMVVKPPLWS